METSIFKINIYLFQLLIIALLISSCGINKHAAYTEGVITQVNRYSHKGSVYFIAKFDYKVGSQVYNNERGVGDIKFGFFKPTEPTSLVGDKYKVIYNYKHPRYSKLLFEYPIFSKNEKFHIQPGKVVRLNPKKEYVDFSYKIFKKDFINSIHVPKDTLMKYPIIRKGAQFQVKVSSRNHFMAVMCFDKPIK